MEWKEFETTFSVKLNQQQKEAVQSTKGPVLLLAVPGSGKTTVLVTRLIFKKRSFIHEKRISDFSPRYETPAP